MLYQSTRDGKFYTNILYNIRRPPGHYSISEFMMPNPDKFWTSNIEYSDYQSFPNWQLITPSCSEQNQLPTEMLTFFCLIKICNILCEYIVQLAIISGDIKEVIND